MQEKKKSLFNRFLDWLKNLDAKIDNWQETGRLKKKQQVSDLEDDIKIEERKLKLEKIKAKQTEIKNKRKQYEKTEGNPFEIKW